MKRILTEKVSKKPTQLVLHTWNALLTFPSFATRISETFALHPQEGAQRPGVQEYLQQQLPRHCGPS